MPDDVLSDARLASLLNTILPGTPDGWLSASAAGIADAVSRDAAGQPARRKAFVRVLEALPTGFPEDDQDEREAALVEIERAQPDAVAVVVSATYLAYYTSPMVLAVLEEKSGYRAEPPQPRGHLLAPFDPSALAFQRRRAPFWRHADD